MFNFNTHEMDETIYLTVDNENNFLVVEYVGHHLGFTVFVLKSFEKWKQTF